jgi:hypothetical protein
MVLDIVVDGDQRKARRRARRRRKRSRVNSLRNNPSDSSSFAMPPVGPASVRILYYSKIYSSASAVRSTDVEIFLWTFPDGISP